MLLTGERLILFRGLLVTDLTGDLVGDLDLRRLERERVRDLRRRTGDLERRRGDLVRRLRERDRLILDLNNHRTNTSRLPSPTSPSWGS